MAGFKALKIAQCLVRESFYRLMLRLLPLKRLGARKRAFAYHIGAPRTSEAQFNVGWESPSLSP